MKKTHGKFRGYAIEVDETGVTYFTDTGEATAKTWKDRPCGHCGILNTPEGHDACLGTLPRVMNACCGHGIVGEAYVQLWDGSRFGGQDALDWISKNKEDDQ